MPNRPKVQQEEEGGEGAPLWIISFADMISLLMAFFVMLSTFSGFGESEKAKLQETGRAALAPNFFGGWYRNRPQGAIVPQSPSAGQPDKGSEKPTLEDGQGKGMMAETKSADFGTHKVFLIESKRVFLGTGTTLSRDGRDFLDLFASFVSQVRDRIVVSESGPQDSSELGPVRAANVVKYLGGCGVSKDRCSIGAIGTLADKNAGNERVLEITLLDASTYK
jgi:chemotaxis protein MotB